MVAASDVYPDHYKRVWEMYKHAFNGVKSAQFEAMIIRKDPKLYSQLQTMRYHKELDGAHIADSLFVNHNNNNVKCHSAISIPKIKCINIGRHPHIPLDLHEWSHIHKRFTKSDSDFDVRLIMDEGSVHDMFDKLRLSMWIRFIR